MSKRIPKVSLIDMLDSLNAVLDYTPGWAMRNILATAKRGMRFTAT